ncbi:CLUMA_CG007102, isoform A [Clunio marinus]|uniref:CLUMA_CG007102, isoform A n=1 Tax=Clunio marinus TaxID=568069 RepID=A0A1J1I5B6_9DIPT|nr:CLUMA_CG007102, isoform A [Clunio marinus]
MNIVERKCKLPTFKLKQLPSLEPIIVSKYLNTENNNQSITVGGDATGRSQHFSLYKKLTKKKKIELKGIESCRYETYQGHVGN